MMMGRLAQVLVAGVVLIAASSMAADGQKKGKEPTATTRPSQRQTVKNLRGEIISVDIEGKTLRVEVKQKQEMKEVELVTDGNTEFLLDGEPVTMVDLRPGMRVSFPQDEAVATRVSARSMNSREQKDFEEKKAARNR